VTVYSDRIKKQGLYDLSFEPKSFWEYSRGSHIDNLIEDTKSFDHTHPVGKGSKFYRDEFIGKSAWLFLSKFNSEYAKRIIEMWSKKGDQIIDPFAGRSSRPLVSTLLERNYIGFDVLKDNLDEATAQYEVLNKQRTMGKLKLIHKSSEFIDREISENVADLVMTCPPYYNLERYDSTDGQLTDIKTYEDFLESYNVILEKATKVLKPSCFFVVVVANFRIDNKFYDFSSDTKDILKRHLTFHDEVILEMSPAKRHALYSQAITNLHCLKSHEYCLVFRKEDTKKNVIDRNNDINYNRPLVKDLHPNRETLFWVDKKDWINEMFNDSSNVLDKFF
tara:strand:+ start:480 stop:1484 length:1005 start_codon:yes stop_codon:yes gene_type:complete